MHRVNYPASGGQRGGSVVHDSGTPYCGLGYLGFFADLGRTGFTGLTPVKAYSTRVDAI
jgi:hypothetical protein